MPTLSLEVVEFTARYLGALEDLQVLMACLDSRERWWDAPGMARQLGIAILTARRSLDRLTQGNLLDIRITGEVRYRFKPGTPALEAAALACGSSYRADPGALVQLITGSATRSLPDFADAFRIRRDDQD